jgi:hypothetical protein
MISTRNTRIWSLAIALTLAATVAAAQPAEQTATQFYMAYRAAFQKAKTIDDLLPFAAKPMREQITRTPAAERTKLFGLMKAVDQYSEVKVLKETKSAAGATLNVEALDGDKKKANATVQLLKENGAWKLLVEDWSTP